MAVTSVPGPVVERESFRGLPCLRLGLPCGDSVLVALHGAHVLSWVAGGRERLYLSPKAILDGHSAIRGGVPVCFPQFNQRGPLPKHGFVRNLPWTAEAIVAPASGNTAGLAADPAQLSLHLRDSDATRALWPQAFGATLSLQLQPGSLQLTLTVRNTDRQPLRFTGALHTYLAVDDLANTQLDGLQGQASWDAVANAHGQDAGTLTFSAEFDRVYDASAASLTLREESRNLLIAQSESFAHIVVWNPGAALCARLPDMPADGFAKMLCVEAAQVLTPVELAPGGTWQGWQCLTVQ